MANREDNIKKINAELEEMSDEELDNVAGGTVAEFDEICSAMVNNPFVKKNFGSLIAHACWKHDKQRSC